MRDVEEVLADPVLASALLRSVRHDEPPQFVRSAKIKLTARCNLRCVMCRYGRGEVLDELEGSAFIRIVHQLAELDCRKVHFSGGEVLARRDLESIVAAACERRLKVTLTSNLTMLDRGRAKELMRHKVGGVSTSLDGATAKRHDGIRGMDGAFRRTLRGMGYLVDERERRGRRTRLRVNFTMMRSNFREYPDVVRLAAEHGAVEVEPMPVDAPRGHPEHRLSKRLIREYNDEVAPRVREARAAAGMGIEDRMVYPYGWGTDAIRASAEGQYAVGYYREHMCFAPYLHMFVAWDGAASLCCMTNGRIALGNVGKHAVAEVFGGPEYQAIRARMKAARLGACHCCDMFLHENKVLGEAIATRGS